MIDIEFVKTIAREAGTRALTMLADIHPEYKADNSLVTHIDRETEQFIRARLEERYPDYAFQGEEFGRHGSDDVPLWCVDPIDGTTNMVFGLPLWGVSIGLVVEGQAVGGAFYLPCTDEMFWGVQGQGSFCNGVKLQVRDRTTIHQEDTVGFTSNVIKTLDVDAIPGRFRCLGSIATEVVYAARGTLCSHIGRYEGLNDLAAALCIAQEAGCIASYLNGEPLDIHAMVREGRTRDFFIVAPPQMAALMRSQLKPRSA